MDPNQRLLWRVVQERSGHRRLLGHGRAWLLLGTLLLVAAVFVVRTIEVSDPDVSERPATDSARPTLRPASTAAPIVSLAATPSLPAASVDTPVAATAARGLTYVVQPGDTLQLIAARNGLQPATLASINQLDQPDLLQPGRSLVIPPTDGVIHVVQPGETLRSIAERYGVDVERVVGANELPDPDHIVAGLVLFIPAENH